MSVATKTHVEPWFGSSLDNGEVKTEGWRIRDCALRLDAQPLVTWNAPNRDLVFARESACAMACRSINEANVDVYALDDEQFGELICRYLQW